MNAINKVEAIQSMVSRMAHLRSSPTVSRKLVSLTKTPEFNMGEVVRCLEHDPALAAKILRVVNSSHYGLSHRVGSIKHAATIIGQRSLRMFAVTFGLVDMLTEGASRKLLDDFWNRASLIASSASRIVTIHDRDHFEEVYTAGLLADVGLLVFAQDTGKSYCDLFKSCDHGSELSAAEEQQFGFTHAELGAQLLRDWEFPSAVVEAVAGHHAAMPGTHSVSNAVRAGNLTAELLDNPSQSRLVALSKFLAEAFGASTESPEAFISGCVADIQKAEDVFGHGAPSISEETLEELSELVAASVA